MDGRILIREVVWYNRDMFKRIEEILREKALNVYGQYLLGEKTEEELLKMGEASAKYETIEKLLMTPEELFNHEDIKEHIAKSNINMDTFNKALNYYSRRCTLNRPTSDKLNSEARVKLNHNVMMLIEGEGSGVGHLKGYFYSQLCSKAARHGVEKDHCLTDWCNDHSYRGCPKQGLIVR
jgi:hypothetical protein